MLRNAFGCACHAPLFHVLIFTRFAAVVSKSLDIHPESLLPAPPAGRRLLVELAPSTLSVVLWDNQLQSPVAAESFNGQIGKAEDRQVIMDQSRLLAFNDLQTLVISAFPNIVPIPSYLYNPASAIQQQQLLYGEQDRLYTDGDLLQDHDMLLSWQMPATVHQFFVNRFKVLQIRHLVSGLIKSHTSNTSANGNIVVYGSRVWILLWQDSQLLIAKSVEVGHPDDLSYNLLNICRQFSVEPVQTQWHISGMVEQDSPLWAAVSRFFAQVSEMPSNVSLHKDIPGYYFAHLF